MLLKTIITRLTIFHLQCCTGAMSQFTPVRQRCEATVCICADACATFTQERHDNSLRAIKGFCRERTLSELKAELKQAP